MLAPPRCAKVTPLPPGAKSAPLEAMDVITGSDTPTGAPATAARPRCGSSTADSTTSMPGGVLGVRAATRAS